MGKGGMSLEEENKAAWLLGVDNLKVLPFNLPPLGPHDVRVRMKAVGICGSDVHFLKTLELAGYVVKEPMVLGHECAGIVEEIGSKDVAEEVLLIHKAMASGVDITFDCAGFNKTMSTALNATKSGGKVCLVGMGHNEMTVPLTPAAAKEVDIIGVFRYKNTWPLCLEFLSSGKIDVKPLITHRFGFSQEEVEEAFETSARGGNAVKVMFNL